MNQILVTQKLYVTPELKRKKKVYKFEFFLSVFVLCVLLSAYIYAEEQPQEEQQEEISNTEQEKPIVVNTSTQKTTTGYSYTTVATISIPKINIKYPIIDGPTDTAQETEELLKISLTKFWGPEPNEVGNFCIVGHNYRNSKFFSKISTLQIGDIINVTDLSGRVIEYMIYDKNVVEPTDVSCTSQLTEGRKEITLITCTTDSKHRTIIKARERI